MNKFLSPIALFLFCATITLPLAGCGSDDPAPLFITGKVTNVAGNNIAGATVSTSPSTVTTSTDSEGNFSLSCDGTGPYTVYASKDGFTESVETVAPANVDLVLGTMIAEEDFENYSLGIFSGGGRWTVDVVGADSTLDIVSEAKTGARSLRAGAASLGAGVAATLQYSTTAPSITYLLYLKPSTVNSNQFFMVLSSGNGILGLFYYNGHFINIISGSAEPDQGEYAPDKWYKIMFKIDRTEKTYSLWIDDVLKIDKDYYSNWSDIPDGFQLGASVTAAEAAFNYSFFDGLKVYSGPE